MDTSYERETRLRLPDLTPRSNRRGIRSKSISWRTISGYCHTGITRGEEKISPVANQYISQ